MNRISKAQWTMRLFGWFKIPMIAFCRPKVLDLTNSRCEIEIKKRRRTKNHLNSIYIGVFAIGADITLGLMAFEKTNNYKSRRSILFKSFEADFLKRALSSARFVCEDGALIDEMVERSVSTGERENKMIALQVFDQDELVANLKLELSIKIRPE